MRQLSIQTNPLLDELNQLNLSCLKPSFPQPKDVSDIELFLFLPKLDPIHQVFRRLHFHHF
jgi:hypothetical protein